MAEKSKREHLLLNALFSNWFFPAAMLAWGVLYISFGEKIPANNGLGWDGVKYAQITRDLLRSPIIDNYYVLRIFPPILVHAALSSLSLGLTDLNIVRSFELLNLFSLVIATYVLKLCLDELRISRPNQLLAFSLFLLSHPVAKGLFYFPMLTDAPAICLGALSLYFYLKDEKINLVLTTVIATFTLPLLLFLNVILLAFPRQNIQPQPQPLPKYLSTFLSLCSASFITYLVCYWAIYRGVRIDYPFALQIDLDLIYLSLIFVVIPYYFYADLLSNRAYLQISYWKQSLRPLCLVLAVVVYISLQWLAAYLNYEGKKSGYLTFYHTVSGIAVVGIARPAIAFTSLFSYYGTFAVLMIFFWRAFARKTLEFGPGLASALFVVGMAFGANAQSRVLSCVFVWLIVLLVYSINHYHFSRVFYVLVPILNFAVSRVWFPIRYNLGQPVGNSETIGFPNQWALMNLGLWVSEEVWLGQLIVLILTLILFGQILYRVRIERYSLIFEKRYI